LGAALDKALEFMSGHRCGHPMMLTPPCVDSDWSTSRAYRYHQSFFVLVESAQIASSGTIR
jgi:hypothetical protein